jgi:hypothetical protein
MLENSYLISIPESSIPHCSKGSQWSFKFQTLIIPDHRMFLTSHLEHRGMRIYRLNNQRVWRVQRHQRQIRSRRWSQSIRKSYQCSHMCLTIRSNQSFLKMTNSAMNILQGLWENPFSVWKLTDWVWSVQVWWAVTISRICLPNWLIDFFLLFYLLYP